MFVQMFLWALQAVIVGHQMPHEEVKHGAQLLSRRVQVFGAQPGVCDAWPRHAYVHFSNNADAKKARKEKDGGAIGKARSDGWGIVGSYN